MKTQVVQLMVRTIWSGFVVANWLKVMQVSALSFLNRTSTRDRMFCLESAPGCV